MEFKQVLFIQPVVLLSSTLVIDADYFDIIFFQAELNNIGLIDSLYLDQRFKL